MPNPARGPGFTLEIVPAKRPTCSTPKASTDAHLRPEAGKSHCPTCSGVPPATRASGRKTFLEQS